MKLFESLIQSQKTVSELKIRTKDTGQFSAGSINKAIPNFRKRLRRYVEADEGHFQHLL